MKIQLASQQTLRKKRVELIKLIEIPIFNAPIITRADLILMKINTPIQIGQDIKEYKINNNSPLTQRSLTKIRIKIGKIRILVRVLSRKKAIKKQLTSQI